jgi:flagellar hook assembly protein FlgD
VKTIVGEQKAAGEYSVRWDGSDNDGDLLPSGLYLYRIETDEFVESKKMLIMK